MGVAVLARGDDFLRQSLVSVKAPCLGDGAGREQEPCAVLFIATVDLVFGRGGAAVLTCCGVSSLHRRSSPLQLGSPHALPLPGPRPLPGVGLLWGLVSTGLVR